MFLSKINGKKSGILLYGITPPKAHTPTEKIIEISEKARQAISPLDIDGLVIYDVQDESSRTPEERPFPFSSALDPFEYTSRHLHTLPVPKIIYRPAGMFTTEELSTWLENLKAHSYYPVFVGVPSPDYVPKTSLPEAYAIWRNVHAQDSVIGAVTIPERHAILKDEDVRMLDKVEAGVSYFISQCIFNLDYTTRMLEDLIASCRKKDRDVPTIIFTLTICGSSRTLDFMEWLGIHVPEHVKDELKTVKNPAARSVEIAYDIARGLVEFCQQNAVPFGFNIESVSTRNTEVAASLDLLHIVRELLEAKGLRGASSERVQVSTATGS